MAKRNRTPAGHKMLGHQKMVCQVCDSNIVDSANVDSGKFYKAFGKTCSDCMIFPSHVLFAICPHCKVSDAVHLIKSVERLVVKEEESALESL